MAINMHSAFGSTLPKHLKENVPDKLMKQINEMENQLLLKENFSDLIIKENQCLLKQVQVVRERDSQNIAKMKEEASSIVQQLLDDTSWYRKYSEDSQKTLSNLETAYRRKTFQLNNAQQQLMKCEEQNIIFKRYIEMLRDRQNRLEIESREFGAAYVKLKDTIRAFAGRLAEGQYVIRSTLDVESLLKSLTQEVEYMQSDITMIDTALSVHGLVPAPSKNIMGPEQFKSHHMVPVSELMKSKREKKMWQNKYERLEKDIKQKKDQIALLNDYISSTSSKFTRFNLQVHRYKSMESELRIAQAQLKNLKIEIEKLQCENASLAKWKAQKLRHGNAPVSTSKAYSAKAFLSSLGTTTQSNTQTKSVEKPSDRRDQASRSPSVLSLNSSRVMLHIPSELKKKSEKITEPVGTMTSFFKNILVKAQQAARSDIVREDDIKELTRRKDSSRGRKLSMSLTASSRNKILRHRESTSFESAFGDDKRANSVLSDKPRRSLLSVVEMVKQPQISSQLTRAESIKIEEFLSGPSTKLLSKPNKLKPSISTTSLTSGRTLHLPIHKQFSNLEQSNVVENRETFPHQDTAQFFSLEEENVFPANGDKNQKSITSLQNLNEKNYEEITDIENAELRKSGSLSDLNKMPQIGISTALTPTIPRLELSKVIESINSKPNISKADTLLRKYIVKKKAPKLFRKE